MLRGSQDTWQLIMDGKYLSKIVCMCVCVTFPSLAIKRRSDEVDEPLCGQ